MPLAIMMTVIFHLRGKLCVMSDLSRPFANGTLNREFERSPKAPLAHK
jgi:hypothetical protein